MGLRPRHPRRPRRLISGGLIDIGAHTVTHPALSAVRATFAAVSEAGFELAGSNRSGVVSGSTDPLDLRPVYVRDVDARTFEDRLHECVFRDG
jgi:hypothetical protein